MRNNVKPEITGEIVGNTSSSTTSNEAAHHQAPHTLSVSPSALSIAQRSEMAGRSSDDIDAEGGGGSSAQPKNGTVGKKQQLSPMRLLQRLLGRNYDTGEVRRVVRRWTPEFKAQFHYCDNSIKTSRYNFLTFLPLNLFEQFTRFANIYFLLLVILQACPVISPFNPLSTAAALIFVLAVTAIKDGVDDIFRHKSDNKINNRTASILTNDGGDGKGPKLKTVRWHSVRVGDIVMLQNNEHIPADMLLLSSSESSGLCFIETADLDGETNLKYRQALNDTLDLGDDLQRLAAFDGEIQCEPPNNHLTRFEGRLNYKGERLSLNNSAILLRGCTIRNTAWAFGIVIFTGQETKLMKNAGKSIFKRTRIDRLANKFLLSIFSLLIALIIIAAILGWNYERGFGKAFKDSYSLWMDVKGINPELIAVLQLFSYLILIQTLIPISLYVTFEIIRIMLSWGYINGDREMYYLPTDTPAVARTMTLNEELGQIEYIFSDKTGTLTQNIMTFNKCTIAGKVYGNVRDPQSGRQIEITAKNAARYKVEFSNHNPNYWEESFQFYDKSLLDDVKRNVNDVHEFFTLIALCHTINAEVDENGQLLYKAQSPDEAALVGAARNFGFVYKCRSPNSITLDILGEEVTYDMLCILDFDNVRKRMSVVVQRNGRRQLLCKGADTCILELLKPGQHDMVERTKAHLNEFAGTGLRTLCCAVRDIDDATWRAWFSKYQRASTSLDNRESKTYECFVEIEQDLTLLGATAVEDKLQEGVPETIYNLSKAGIKIWVLTGDKQETAINIGYSCNMLRDTMEEFIVDSEDYAGVERQLRTMRDQIERVKRQMHPKSGKSLATSISAAIPMVQVGSFGSFRAGASVAPIAPATNQQHQQPPSRRRSLADQFALIINGHSLYHALEPTLEELFLEVACACQAVICCRVAPLQKGKVVDLVKRRQKCITLAIGDGANDVNMIKQAHIGIGISGQEGMQAVLSSDFSFGQFRFLQRLLLVHGRWSYIRVAKFLRYFFYKNFAFTLCHFWFGIYCGWSAASVYDQWYITLYNIIYTSTPIICLAWVEQDVNAYYSQTYPNLYYPGPKDMYFNLPFFLLATFEGLCVSIVTFFFMAFGFADYSTPDGDPISASAASLAVACATTVTLIVTIRVALETIHWTWFSLIWAPLSALAVFIFQILVAEVLEMFEIDVEFFKIGNMVWKMPTFWLSCLVAAAVCCLPLVLGRFLEIIIRTPLTYRVQMKQVIEKKKPDEYNQLALRRGASMMRRSRLGSGFAFSQQPGFGSMISRGVLREGSSSSRPGSGNARRPSVSLKRNSVGPNELPLVEDELSPGSPNHLAPKSLSTPTSRASSRSPVDENRATNSAPTSAPSPTPTGRGA